MIRKNFKKIGILPSIRENINLSYEEKLEQTKNIIRHHFKEFSVEEQTVAFSGGKDSEALLYLIYGVMEELGIEREKLVVYFTNTGVEYPETIQFIKELKGIWDINLVILKPEGKNFWKCVEEYGYPRPKSDRKGKNKKAPQCCVYLKEKPGNKFLKEGRFKAVYRGITALESHQRQIRAVTHGICYHNIKQNICIVHPIIWWSEEEVWRYIRENNLPYNRIYEKVDRCGCMPCTAYKLWHENLQATNPKMYRKVMSDMGQELIT